MDVEPPEIFKVPLNVFEKTMTGPGPSNYPERVRQAMSLPVLGQLHQETFKIMDDIKEGIKYLFQTKNSLTFCISGPGALSHKLFSQTLFSISSPGHAGLECAFANLLEDGDKVLIACQGIELLICLGVDNKLRFFRNLGTACREYCKAFEW